MWYLEPAFFSFDAANAWQSNRQLGIKANLQDGFIVPVHGHASDIIGKGQEHLG